MSFIGAGELEHKVTQLQRQLDHKDHELNSIKNEQRKRDEESTKAKRAKEDAEYKLRDEAERAHQAEKSVMTKNTEISQFKLKLSNLESSLTQTSDKLKKEEKEKERVQDALDVALNSGSDGASLQIKSLQARTKQLEDALKVSEHEKEKFRSQGNLNDPWGTGETLTRGERNKVMALQNQVESLKEENARLQSSGSSQSPTTDLFSSSTSPSRLKNKRRSMSVSGPAPSELIELENQISTLQEQLVSRKRDLDKAVNEKLAIEAAGKKKTSKLESELEDVKEELDFYRRNEGSGGDGKEVEKLKKTMQIEKEALQAKLDEKQTEITQKIEQVKELERKAERVEALEADLEKERNARQALETSSAPSGSSSPSSTQLQEAQGKIQSLEAELAKARSTSSASASSKGGDMEIRHVKRELQKALRDKDYLESLVKENDELLAEKDDEIARMKTAIPIPGSPVLGAHVNNAKIEELEAEIITLEDKIEMQREKYEVKHKQVEGKLQSATSDLEKIKRIEEELSQQLQQSKEDAKDTTAQRDTLQTDLKTALDQLSVKQTEVDGLNSQLEQLRNDVLSTQAVAQAAQQEATEIKDKMHEAERSFSEKEKLLDDLVARRDELESVLSMRSHNDEDYDALSQSLMSMTDDMAKTQASLSSGAEMSAQLQAQAEVASKEKTIALEKVGQLSAAVETAERHLEDAQTEMESRTKAKDEIIQLLTDQLDDLKTDFSAIQLKLDDKIAELAVSTASQDEVQTRFEEAVKSLVQVQAKLTELEDAQSDRSTESEAREKDEELFQVQEEKSKLERELQIAKGEYEKELASSTFKFEQDLLESQKRVDKLEHQVTDLQSALSSAQQPKSFSKHEKDVVLRLEQKIGQLRSERDDLRHNLSFVQNERHFAIRAALSEKEAANEEVNIVQAELKQRTVVGEKLQAELEEVKTALVKATTATLETNDNEESERLMTQISSLEHELASQVDKIKDFKNQLRSREETLSSLQNQAQAAESRAEGLQRELLEMINHVGQTTKLSDPPRQSSVPEETNDLPTDLVLATNGERTRRTSLGHMRSRSNASVSVMQNLNVERQLQAKIGRRDARIAELTHELEKANLNLILAKEAQEETFEEITELTQERDRLQARLQDNSEHSQVVEVENPSILRSTILALITYRQSVKSAEARWRVASDILSKSRATAEQFQATIAEFEVKTKGDTLHLTQLEEEKSSLELQLGSLQAEEVSSRSQLEAARESIDDLQSRLATAEAATKLIAESAPPVSSYEAQIAEKEDRIRELKAQNIEFTSRVEELEKDIAKVQDNKDEEITSLNRTISELEAELQESQGQIRGLTAGKEGLKEEIAAAERALAEGMAASDRQREKMEDKYKEVEAKVIELEGLLQDKVSQLEETLRKSVTLESDLDNAKNREKEMSDSSEEDKGIIERLGLDLAHLRESSESSSSVVDQLRQEIASLQDASRSLGQEKEAVINELSDLKSYVLSTDQRSGEIQRKLEENVVQLNEAKKAKEEVDALINQIQVKLESSEESRKATEQSLEGIKIRMDEISSQLVSAQEELTSAREEAMTSSAKSAEQQSELDQLREKNAELVTQLEKAQSSATDVDESLVTDLKERIEQLEISLTHKTEEVDEADDRTREAFKSNAKLEKKIGKLQRQLEASQVEKNTALNKLASRPIPTPTTSISRPVESQPTSVAPSSTPAAPAATTTTTPAFVAKPRVVSAPASTPSQRTPLSSVNIFQPSPNNHVNPPSTGHKRHREDDPVKPKVEAIMQLQPIPPHSYSPRKPIKSTFTPQRGVFAPLTNPTSQSHSQQTMNKLSIFSNTNEGVDISKQKPAFPLPPTRSAFQPRQ
ncbi:uncharacterized protein IL334_007289 [Kwoniella shivajii]|uniref:Nucleoprotein TPR/MLP1 domain-containing protein n=1 Tax=Kwoniella shivajii TaxID=564305 RepID=A0ABZ1D923_9TREE|nr:hypothetical protein IL334_007289 [Kwoniella shivajii]